MSFAKTLSQFLSEDLWEVSEVGVNPPTGASSLFPWLHKDAEYQCILGLEDPGVG